MLSRFPELRRLQVLVAATAAFGLCACSFQIKEPSDGSVVTIPTPTSTTKVVLTGSNYTLTKVTADGTDVTGQMVDKGSNTFEGDLNIAPGTHTIVANADVSCFYCIGGQSHVTDTKTFCVEVAGATVAMPMTPFEQGGSMQSWRPSEPNVSLTPDAGTKLTRWQFARLAGAFSEFGVIISAQTPCLCLRSPDDKANSAIALAVCDFSDMRQQWHGLQWQLSGGKGFFQFENRQNSINGTPGCITDGGANQIVQRDCNHTPDQLWSIHDETTNTFMTGSPWNP